MKSLILCILIFNISLAQTDFYSQGNLDITLLSSWNTERNGSGSVPLNFTVANQIFNVQNDHSMIASSKLTISGSESKMNIESGGMVTTSGFNHKLTLDMHAGAIYSVNSSYIDLSFGTLNSTSEFHLNSNNLRPTLEYPTLFWNVDANATPSSDLTINGDLIINAGELRGAATLDRSYNIGGSLKIKGGTFVGSNDSKNATINIGSNLEVINGTLKGTNSSGNATFNLGGNLSNDGIWEQGSGSGVFEINLVNIDFVQTIGGSSPISCDNLGINTNEGVIINNDIEVTDVFTHTIGLITLGSNNFILGAGDSYIAVPGSSTMFVATSTGELRKVFSSTGSFTFPVGTSTEYSPVTLNFTSGSFTDAVVGINLKDIKNPNNNSTINFLNKYWKITSLGTTNFSCDLICQYVDNDVSDVIGFTESLIYGGSWNGTNWTLLNPVDADNNLITGTVTSFSYITGGDIYAMPVQLSSFTSSIINNEIHLNWRTETEVSNYGFDVERTPLSPPFDKGGKQGGWETIGFVEGHGCSNSPKEYCYVDQTVSSGKYFYRLKQIDTDGKFEYSKIVEVDFDKPVVFKLEQNFPNPFNPTTTIKFQFDKSTKADLKIYNVLGNEVANLFNETVEAGKLYEVDFNASDLASGVYYYRLTGDNRTEIRKMMLLK